MPTELEFDVNRKVSVKVDTLTYNICADTFRVLVSPQIGGQASVVDLIDGSRYSRFASPRFHFDLVMTWGHTSQYQYRDELMPLIEALIAQAATAATKKFFPFQPYVDGSAIDFVPVIDEQLIAFRYTKGSRNRGLSITLKSESVQTVLPNWLKESTA